MKYDKLVRDKIPEIIKGKGGIPKTRIADEKEYKQKLQAKLREETDEYLTDPNPEELADILEIVYALGGLHKVTAAELEEQRRKKAEERGGFEEGIILEES